MKEVSSSQKNSPLAIIGKKNQRVDARDKSTGRAVYADDIQLPGTLYAVLKRSTLAHGTIRSIDTSAALAMDGVKAVLTGADLPNRFGIMPTTQDETALAVDKVRYVGEPVAAVCAGTEAIARRAADAITVEYEPADNILTLERAFNSSARVHDSEKFDGNAHRVIALEFGDVAAALEKSDYDREDAFYFAGNTHVPMEMHSTTADWDGSRLSVYVSHQAPYYIQKILPGALGIPPQSLRVVVPYVGGGFGGKLDVFPDTVCAARFSMICGRPVKCTLSREEVFYNHRGRHPAQMWVRTSIRDGKISGMHFKAYLDGGAYGSFGTATSYYFGALQPTTYEIPNYKVDIVRFYTNKPPCGPKRGHGTPQPRYALECHLDKIAEDLQVSPHELRRKSLIKPFSVAVNHIRVTSCGLDECMKSVVEASDFENKRGRLPFGEGLGFAVGSYMCGAALPIYWNHLPHSSVVVKANRNGAITAYSGHTEIGQGSDTVLSYIVAEKLGIATDDVALVLRDSDVTPSDLGSYSSRVTYMMGNAAAEAAQKLKDVLAETAAAQLDVPAADLVFENRRIFSVKQAGRSISLEEAIARMEEKHGLPSFTGSYKPDVKYGDYRGAGAGPSPAYSYAAAVIHVSVDPGTGMIKAKKVWLAHDTGRCINRKNVEGQVEGGVYMGLGEVMMEEMVYTKTGLLKNAGLLDYKTPSINETADIWIDLIESEEPGAPFGAKEVGQGPLLPVIPAFANAVYDAIGVRFDEIPITPDKILKALERKSTRVGPNKIIDFPFPDPISIEAGCANDAAS